MMELQAYRPEDSSTPFLGAHTSSRAVLDHVATGIYAVDHAGRCTQVNPAALSLMGYSEAECLGRDMHSLIHGTYEDGTPYPVEKCPVYDARVEGRPVYNFDEILWTKNGKGTPVECSAVPISMDDRQTGAVVTLVPKQRLAAEQSAEKGSTAQLLQAKEMIESRLLESEKMATVGRLTASIAHEINNPLEALTNLLYLVRQEDSLPSDCQQYLSQADEELRRVTEIVSQTLRFHRTSTQPARCTPEALVESVLALHQGKLRNSEIRINRQHRRSESFMCPEGDLRQILNNLLSNAIDATKERGGTITIRTSPARDAHTGKKGMRISIADTGHGMDRDLANRIFEPLYTTKGSSGSGLGLWISSSIAKRHGGRLSVRSSTRQHKRGTTFSLFVPHAT